MVSHMNMTRKSKNTKHLMKASSMKGREQSRRKKRIGREEARPSYNPQHPPVTREPKSRNKQKERGSRGKKAEKGRGGKAFRN
jgi:hypothetical protein